MEFVKLKCPSCGADLNVDNGLDTFFCQYCGAKILLHGQNSDALQAKAKVKIVETEANKELEMQKEKHRAEKEEREFKAKEDHKVAVGALIWFAALISIIGLVMLIVNIAGKNELKQLETIYQEIQIDIENGNYDEALIKTNRLRASDKQNLTVRMQWASTRNDLVRQIKRLQKEANLG